MGPVVDGVAAGPMGHSERLPRRACVGLHPCGWGVRLRGRRLTQQSCSALGLARTSPYLLSPCGIGQLPAPPFTLKAHPAQDPDLRGNDSVAPSASALLVAPCSDSHSWPQNQSFWGQGNPHLPSEVGVAVSYSHLLSKSSTSAGSWNNQKGHDL